jgi:hypothetical protein
MSPSDFDPDVLRRGTEVELEHTSDRKLAQKIAMDHLVEHPRYYEELDRMEQRLEARPNRRVKVYDAYDMAADMRRNFHGSGPDWEYRYDFDWPPVLQNVGDSLAVVYESDKRIEPGDTGDWILYKHLAESRNRAFVAPGLLHDASRPSRAMRVRGPMVNFEQVPMPDSFAVLALFEEADLKLYQNGSNAKPHFGRGKDAGVIKVTVRHGMLGGCKICWSEVDKRRADQPFLLVYTEDDGVLMLVVGDELDIKHEGIVG